MDTSRATNGEAIRAIREALGHRQEAIAAAAGITAAYLSNIEAGRKQPSASVASAIAAALGVKVAAITYPVLTPPAPTGSTGPLEKAA